MGLVGPVITLGVTLWRWFGVVSAPQRHTHRRQRGVCDQWYQSFLWVVGRVGERVGSARAGGACAQPVPGVAAPAGVGAPGGGGGAEGCSAAGGVAAPRAVAARRWVG